jgi:hypothetical protein
MLTKTAYNDWVTIKQVISIVSRRSYSRTLTVLTNARRQMLVRGTGFPVVFAIGTGMAVTQRERGRISDSTGTKSLFTVQANKIEAIDRVCVD